MIHGVLSCVAVVAFASPVIIESDYPAPYGHKYLRISAAEHRDCVDSLRLDAGQVAGADAIHDRYAAEFDEAMHVYKQAVLWLDAIGPGTYGAYDPGLYESYHSADAHAMDAVWQEMARRLERRYFADLGALVGRERGIVESSRHGRFRRRVLATMTPYANGSDPVAFDVTVVLADVAPEQLDDPELALMLAVYTSALEALLAARDQWAWRQGHDSREAQRALRETIAVDSAAAAIARTIDKAVELLARSGDVTWKLHRLNERTVTAVANMLPLDRVESFRAKASRRLYPYAYADIGVRDPESLLGSALGRDDLTVPQRESLRDLRVLLKIARDEAVARIKPLHERKVNRRHARDLGRAWFESMVSRYRTGEREDIDESIRGRSERNRRAFDKAVFTWRQTLDTFEQQVQSVLASKEQAGP